MLKRSFWRYQPKFNIIYTSHYDLNNHGIVTFSHFPIWTPTRTNKIKWMEENRIYDVPCRCEIKNNQLYSYFLFKDISSMEISQYRETYNLILDVKLELLPVCVYENKDKKMVEKRMLWLKKMFDTKFISYQN
jgi:hypothetical protein